MAVTRKLIKYSFILLLASSVFAGGDDRDEQGNVEEEIAAFEAQLEAELAQEAIEREIAEFEAEWAAQQAKLEAELFEAEWAAQQAKLEAELFEAEWAAQQAKLEEELFEAEWAAQQAKLEEELFEAEWAAQQAKLAEEIAAAEAAAVVAAHEACKHALDLKLSASNIALFHSALADGTLFNIGPQITSGTEFGSNRWDEYAECVSNYVNPF
jgi:hypothetical protein